MRRSALDAQAVLRKRSCRPGSQTRRSGVSVLTALAKRDALVGDAEQTLQAMTEANPPRQLSEDPSGGRRLMSRRRIRRPGHSL